MGVAKDIRGIGFVSADTIASNLGIAKDSLIRARAGLSHALLEATSNWHCALPLETLIENTQKLLGIESSLVKLAIEKSKTNICDLIKDKPCIFLASYHFYGKQIAKVPLSINQEDFPWGDNNSQELIPEIE